MEPFQLWLPLMGPSPGVPEVQRDISRAFRAWNGENRVWLLPWVEESRSKPPAESPQQRDG